MATAAQLRAVLAVLQADMAHTASGWSAEPPVERAELAGRLHGLISSELRDLVIQGPLGQSTGHWSMAATAEQDAVGDVSAQAQFDARWLRHNIATLASRNAPTPVPALLAAAVQAVDAATTLLALARDPRGEGSQAAWQAVIDDLAIAFHLVNDEHEAVTQPIR
ncbi:hypothetical protein [Nocardia anaemiae]|uniref:hypothetical protein n=1 Tax=Nocardia anaemiae TaxID=263910 RepID=UPI000B0B37EF|nr:hypothetical protein [Nocardia anaemiae]